jgi:hypothetical protein
MAAQPLEMPMSEIDQILDLICDGKLDPYETKYVAQDLFPDLSKKECEDLQREAIQAIADGDSAELENMYDR